MQVLANVFFAAVCLLQACWSINITKPACTLKCNQGECQVSARGPQCVCPPGFSGLTCEIRECSKFCKDKGMCYVEHSSNKSSDGQCNCTTNCGSQSTCDGRCFNGGTCHMSKTGSPQCICTPGFTGIYCQNCTNLECHNGGICVNNGTGTQTCQCINGYQGKNCENDGCDGFCLHGGVCTRSPGRLRKCTCPPIYSGPRCDINMCLQPVPPADICNGMNSCGCLSNGTCETRFGDKVCNCTQIWGGDKCQYYLGHNNPCINRCHNNGICIMQNPRVFPSCICSDGWTGEKCDKRLDCQFYCHNGGSCFIRNGSPSCECTLGYKGTHCHQVNKNTYIGSSSVVLPAMLACGISVLVLLSFGAIYYILKRRHKFFRVRLLENDFNNPMFQERDFD